MSQIGHSFRALADINWQNPYYSCLLLVAASVNVGRSTHLVAHNVVDLWRDGGIVSVCSRILTEWGPFQRPDAICIDNNPDRLLRRVRNEGWP